MSIFSLLFGGWFNDNEEAEEDLMMYEEEEGEN